MKCRLRLMVLLLYGISVIAGGVIFTGIVAQKNTIRPEEISESVRGALWFAHHRVFQGLSGHIGWYAQLSTVYTLFGFQLDFARYYRLFLAVISIIALASIIKKYLGITVGALIVLASYAFSPLFLYFNTLALHFGIDLVYTPIILFLLDRLSFASTRTIVLAEHVTLWALIMVSCMSYPTGLIYIPAFLYMYIWKLRHSVSIASIRFLSCALVGLIMPLALGIAWIGNRRVLLMDPTDGSGIFRGAGRIDISGQSFERIVQTVQSFAGGVPSYYVEVAYPDLSHGLMLAAGFLIALLIYIWFLEKRLRPTIVAIALTCIMTIVLIGGTIDTGGLGFASIRRSTSLIVCLAAALGVVGVWVKGLQSQWLKLVITTCMLIIPIHHLLVLPVNMSLLQKPSMYAEWAWFPKGTKPDGVLDGILSKLTREDYQLTCTLAQIKTPLDCSYNRIYAVVESMCYFNHLPCKRLSGFDPYVKMYRPLTVGLWDKSWTWEKYESEVKHRNSMLLQ